MPKTKVWPSQATARRNRRVVPACLEPQRAGDFSQQVLVRDREQREQHDEQRSPDQKRNTASGFAHFVGVVAGFAVGPHSAVQQYHPLPEFRIGVGRAVSTFESF